MTLSSLTSAAREIGHDHAVAEHIDAVAVTEFVHFGRVPEEGPAGRAPRRRMRS